MVGSAGMQASGTVSGPVENGGKVTDPEPLNENLQKVAETLKTQSLMDKEAFSSFELAELLNTPTDQVEAKRIAVSVLAVRESLLVGGFWAGLIEQVNKGEAGAVSLLAWLSPPHVLIPTDRQEVHEAFVGYLKGLPAEAADPILRLCHRQQSWSEANLGEKISPREIQLARREA